MNPAEIALNLERLASAPFDAKQFAFTFLAAYDAPKITVSKIRNGSGNYANQPGDVLWKKKLFYSLAKPGQAAKALDALAVDPLVQKHDPRFLIATDGVDLFATDRKSDDSLSVPLIDLGAYFDFFLPLAGIERHNLVTENEADVKAAGRLAKLYDEILAANPDWIGNGRTHELNLLMTRLLFCFFAEDTGIFEDRLFTSTLMDATAVDGSDTHEVLSAIFDTMSVPARDRKGRRDFTKRFPYVNGGLFKDETTIPKFSKHARRYLKVCGDLHWREINPDIFGSMIQVIVDPAMRGDMGMHYTSVPNIMKVLNPLFLDSLREDLEAAGTNEKKLERLLGRIQTIRVFDPACGSGNFLIIAYREMRKIEMEVFERLVALNTNQFLPMTGVSLKQFYGIELADFAAETAKLSLWIAEYQMNAQFKAMFGNCPPTLPLSDSGNILQDNSLRVDWVKVCPPRKDVETYLVGNPPYLGSILQTPEQKADAAALFSVRTKNYKDLDYVASFFLKGAQYISASDARLAFLATNSICQGEQAGLLWPHMFADGLEISFAHQSFKWKNNAASNAGISCVVVGLRRASADKKVIYNNDHVRVVPNIGPYLTAMANITVSKASRPMNMFPPISWGNQPVDGGHLILAPKERDGLIRAYPAAAPLVRRYIGSREFIKGIERWCLWITDEDLDLAESIPPIKARIMAVRKSRLKGGQSAMLAAGYPHRFVFAPHQDSDAILVTQTSSEKRRYLPIGIVDSTYIISNLASAIYGAEPWVFAVLSSRLHALWTAAVGGHLEDRLRYSNTLVYNTFPLPKLSEAQRATLNDCTLLILASREANPGKTIAWLYDPKNMPANLLNAHEDVDDALERMYIGRPFANDTERVEHLFKLYAQMAERTKSLKPARNGQSVVKEAARA